MGELTSKNFAPQEPQLLEKINTTLEALGRTARWTGAPEALEGAEVLRDKTITMVDDEAGVLEAFVPHLIVATDGKAIFIKYEEQTAQELAQQIEASGANLVLLDYHLSKIFKGSAVCRALQNDGFTGDMVGFSSDGDAQREFRDAGAIGSVNKEAGFPESSVSKLAELLKSTEKPERV